MLCSPILLLWTLWIMAVDCSRPKVFLPIQPEQEPLQSKTPAGCTFGGKFYSLEDSWHPDLGDPFGVMHCVLCYCEPRSRRGKPSGKVSCKNIKHDCPSPSCSNPVLLSGHCCKTCPKAPPPPIKKSDFVFDGFEYFHGKDDDLYNDRSYLSSDDVTVEENRSEYVALLTAPSHVWPPVTSGVAKARFNLQRSSLLFSITYKWIDRLSRIRFSDLEGSVLFEHPVHRMGSPRGDTICGIWRSLNRSTLRLLRMGHILVSLVTTTLSEPEISGKIVKHKALFSESFSALLTPEDSDVTGGGGLAMLTLSDVDDNLHFILMLRGLRGGERDQIQILVQILHQNHVIRELYANISAQEQDFAEVLPDLSSREMQWLAQGQLEISVQTEGRRGQRMSGIITVRKSCDTLQSVLSGGDALNPTKTGAVGSASITLHENGTMEYQIQIAGTTSAVTAVTLETKPRRKTKRNILHDMTKDYQDGRVWGYWIDANARDLHMLLQSELFLNVATKDFQEGELRGQITPLLYSGLWARYEQLPVPLAGQFVSPPIRTGSAGHAWVSLDEHCHLHYQIVVTGLGKAEDAALNAHLHGFAELGEVGESTPGHKRLLKGFYGSEAQGSVKDLDLELLGHLSRGTAFIQVSTKLNPRGEIRGQVHIPNNCESGGVSLTPEEPEYEYELYEEGRQRDPEDLRKDPRACFFEGQLRAHGSRWAPDYDRKCSVCSCQKRTVICDPIVCPPLNCSQPVHLSDQCCPVCEEKKEIREVKKTERARTANEGCFFDGDRSWKAAGTRWHPFVPPFGLIKCAICTCKGSTGEVHCEKVTCPRLSCTNPIRANPSDCCKQCPVEERSPLELADSMQSDGPRSCKFGRHWYPNNERWHPTVTPFGEMKCVTCACVEGVTQCRRQECTGNTCGTGSKRDRCCTKCKDAKQDEDEKVKSEETRTPWSF
ncbi:chordin isoform X2 [Xenopus tropicalis]|uniref:Chordin n=1 Tax=Xenopus tropicalis TaxID=8364 RepID=A0A8J0SNW3_XENTR|nr:chordin isoform X2 [Xenopus tropicalis]|eukprot:XP_012818431.1 PREDICTED: chordin isoform X2 [Xenopus tropicalis]